MATSILIGNYLRKIYCQSTHLARISRSSKNFFFFRKIEINNNRSNVTNIKQQSSRTGPKSFRGRQAYNVDSALQKMDLAVRKAGRITRKEVNDVFNELKNAGKVTTTQSLLVLRCCGSFLADELPESRTELVIDIWSTLKNLGIELDASHYNALLKVYLENEHEFNPTEFLAEMENKNIHPNRVTYQRLIEHYCQSGDIEGAGKILEHMKQQELPVNEKIFNALITGHARANDMESAKGVLDLMKNAKLEPTADTYAILLCAFAERGDINSIREIIQEAQKSQINLLNEHYLDVIYILAKNGHLEQTDEILLKLQRNAFGFASESIITIYKLINCNQDEIAFKLLKMIPVLSKATGETIPVGNFFIRYMVKMEKSPEKIVEICNELKKLNLNDGSLQRAAEFSLHLGKEEHALKFLQLLKEENFPIRCHYFWPILVAYTKKNEPSKILDTMNLMMNMGAPANYQTFIDYVYPNINVQDTYFIIEKLKSFGYSAGMIVSPLVDFMIQNDDLTEANNLIEKYVIRLKPATVTESLAVAYSETEDIPATIKILKRVKESASKELNRVSTVDWIGVFLLHCFRNDSKSEEKIAPLLQSLFDENLNISQGTFEIIKTKVWPTAPENIIIMLEKLATLSLDVLQEESDQPISHLREMSLEELENHLIELKSKNMNTKGILRRLLLLHVQKKNLQRVEEIVNELDAQNFAYSYGMMAQLLHFYVYLNDLEKASKYFNKLQGVQDFELDTYKVLSYANLLVKENKIDEALKLLLENPNKKSLTGNKLLEGDVWRLLNTVAEKDVDTCQKFFDVVKKNFTKPNNVILGPLIKSYLLKDDLKGALAKFEECCKLYSCTPWRSELILRLIKIEDAEALQKVVDLNNEIHGETNTLHDLAFGFIMSGRYKEARKVFETPGLRARQGRFENMCERLLGADKVEELEQLVKITEDLFETDRERLYLYLIRMYYKTKDHKKALDVWTTMQEESVHPTDETLLYLAKFLQECNQHVPFVIPEEKRNFAEHSISEYALKGQVDKALDKKRELLATGKSPSISDSSSIIKILIQQQRLNEALNITLDLLNKNQYPSPPIFRSLINQFVQNGDIDTIKSLDSKLSEKMKKVVRYNNALFRAYISSDRHLEFIENLENNVKSTVNECPAGAFINLLQNYPDLSDRIHKLAIEYTKYNQFDLLNAVWTYYILTENFAEANAIFKEMPAFQTKLNLRMCLKETEQKQNEELCLKLLEIVKTNQLPSENLGKIYNSLIEIECKKIDFSKAAEYLAKAKSENVDSFLQLRTLNKLSASLKTDTKVNSLQEQKDSARRIEADDSDSEDDKRTRKS